MVTCSLRRLGAFLLLLLTGVAGAAAQGAELVMIDTPRGVKQRFAVTAPAEPVASVILFAGGGGELGLASPTEMKRGAESFLVRSRDKLVAHNLMVALLDVPADRPGGMDVAFRTGSAHAGDIGAVAAYLKQLADVPVWLVGTSMGTFSAAAGAIAADDIDGLVLTSTITRPRPSWKITEKYRDGVASMPLAEITAPALIVAHAEDACELTPAADVGKLKQQLANAKPAEVVLLKGGGEPQAQPCGSMSAHGFVGIEAEAVDAIAAFIKANAPAADGPK
jgi:pimeloyl-ACP methyl ester carboxylesterase